MPGKVKNLYVQSPSPNPRIGKGRGTAEGQHREPPGHPSWIGWVTPPSMLNPVVFFLEPM